MRRRLAATLGLVGVLGLAAPVAALGWAMAKSVRTQRRALAFRPRGPIPAAAPDGRTAIVVFGTQALPDGPSPPLKARLDHAIALWQDRVAPIMVMTGGVADGIDEVVSMTDYAIAHGVAQSAILAARPGQNTRQQVISTNTVAATEHLDPLVGVTSTYHAVRVEAEARRFGMSIRSSSPPTSLSPRELWALTAVDALGVLWYRMPAWITSRVDTSSGSLRHRLPRLLAGWKGPLSTATPSPQGTAHTP